jgi:hypothetical protein
MVPKKIRQVPFSLSGFEKFASCKHMISNYRT